MSGDGVSEVISHVPPTFCIHVPTFDATDAIQSARNSGCRSGVHADVFIPTSRNAYHLPFGLLNISLHTAS